MKAIDLIDHDVTDKDVKFTVAEEDGEYVTYRIPVDEVSLAEDEDGRFIVLTYVVRDQDPAPREEIEPASSFVYKFLLAADLEVEILDRQGPTGCEGCDCEEGLCEEQIGSYTYVDADGDQLNATGVMDEDYTVIVHTDSADPLGQVGIPRADLPVVLSNLFEQAGVRVSEFEVDADDMITGTVTFAGGKVHTAAVDGMISDPECLLADAAFLLKTYERLATALEQFERMNDVNTSADKAQKMDTLRNAYVGGTADPLETQPDWVREAWHRLFDAAEEVFGQ